MKFKVKVPNLLKSVRYTLAAVNVAFLVTGLLLIIVGAVVLSTNQEYETLVPQKFFTVPRFVIATGVIVFVGAILGAYGAYSEQFYFIAGYLLLMVVILIFEMTITIMSFGLRNNAVSEIRPTMMTSLRLYSDRIDVARIWDDLQTGYECCGVAGRHDWGSVRIPVSCCHIDYGTISPFQCTLENAYTTGCASALGEWLSYNAYVIGIVAALVTCLQVIFTAMSAWLAWRSKFEEVELES